jgi:Flp pilus assembly protein TadG
MTASRCQRGVAAIEFAFVLSGLLLLFYGIATFGAVFYAQQAVARAAEDGVRAVAALPNGTAPDETRIRAVVYDSLAQSLVVPLASSRTPALRRAWIVDHVQVSVATSGTDVTVTVAHRYSQNPVVPALAMPGVGRWLPDRLTSRATAVRPT